MTDREARLLFGEVAKRLPSYGVIGKTRPTMIQEWIDDLKSIEYNDAIEGVKLYVREYTHRTMPNYRELIDYLEDHIRRKKAARDGGSTDPLKQTAERAPTTKDQRIGLVYCDMIHEILDKAAGEAGVSAIAAAYFEKLIETDPDMTAEWFAERLKWLPPGEVVF